MGVRSRSFGVIDSRRLLAIRPRPPQTLGGRCSYSTTTGFSLTCSKGGLQRVSAWKNPMDRSCDLVPSGMKVVLFPNIPPTLRIATVCEAALLSDSTTIQYIVESFKSNFLASSFMSTCTIKVCYGICPKHRGLPPKMP